MPKMRTIYHGIDLSLYHFVERKQQYLSFIGRITPLKGTHLAIEVAQRTGIPLKIAGDVQPPMYREYFEKRIRPQIDGKLVEYIGLTDLQGKNELLGNSMAMLFPIQWNEPVIRSNGVTRRIVRGQSNVAKPRQESWSRNKIVQ
jgi:glycosyltransferase involved in cell wall biosynthesis